MSFTFFRSSFNSSSLFRHKFNYFYRMGGSLSATKSVSDVERNMINDIVRKNCVVVFSKTYCTFCTRVKKLFSELQVPFLCIELDKREDGTNLQNALHDMTGAKTVPRVFINTACVGGASDVQKLHEENKLLDKIAECANKKH